MGRNRFLGHCYIWTTILAIRNGAVGGLIWFLVDFTAHRYNVSHTAPKTPLKV